MRCIALDKYKEKTAKMRIPSEYTVSMEDIKDALNSNADVETEIAAGELAKVISSYVRALPARQRYIFIDRYYFAESVEKISADLSIAVSTVYREIGDIKQGLKIHLERNGEYI